MMEFTPKKGAKIKSTACVCSFVLSLRCTIATKVERYQLMGYCIKIRIRYCISIISFFHFSFMLIIIFSGICGWYVAPFLLSPALSFWIVSLRLFFSHVLQVLFLAVLLLSSILFLFFVCQFSQLFHELLSGFFIYERWSLVNNKM